VKKKLVLLLSAVLVVGLVYYAVTGVPKTKEFTIRVVGTEGMKAQGVITVSRENKEKEEMIDITIPWEKKVEADMVSAGFQKKAENGLLKVQLLDEKGEVVRESETSVRFGIAYVVYD